MASIRSLLGVSPRLSVVAHGLPRGFSNEELGDVLWVMIDVGVLEASEAHNGGADRGIFVRKAFLTCEHRRQILLTWYCGLLNTQKTALTTPA